MFYGTAKELKGSFTYKIFKYQFCLNIYNVGLCEKYYIIHIYLNVIYTAQYAIRNMCEKIIFRLTTK